MKRSEKLWFILVLVCCFAFSGKSFSQSDSKDFAQVEAMSMAVQNMDKMLRFYSTIFDIQFEKYVAFDDVLYFAKWRGLKLLFAPSKLAGEEGAVIQNKHQFDVIVKDLNKLMQMIEQTGGTITGAVVDDGVQKTVHAKDPDGNTFIFKQNIK